MLRVPVLSPHPLRDVDVGPPGQVRSRHRRVLCLVKQYSDLPVHLITEILPLMELVTDFVVNNPDVKVVLPLHMLSFRGNREIA